MIVSPPPRDIQEEAQYQWPRPLSLPLSQTDPQTGSSWEPPRLRPALVLLWRGWLSAPSPHEGRQPLFPWKSWGLSPLFPDELRSRTHEFCSWFSTKPGLPIWVSRSSTHSWGLGWGLRIPGRGKLKWSRIQLTMYSYKMRLFSQSHFNSCPQSPSWGTHWTDENTEAEKFHTGLRTQSLFHLFNKYYWAFRSRPRHWWCANETDMSFVLLGLTLQWRDRRKKTTTRKRRN